MDQNNVFYLECPDFETALVDSQTRQTALATRNMDYAHPIDAGIIRVLDAPAVKTAFGTMVDMLADFQQGSVLASGIPVDAYSFPEINAIVDDCVAKLGIHRPYVVISGAVGLNAFTTGSDEEPYIVLGSILVKAFSEEKLRFVIGHECGHIAMGHMIYHTVGRSARSLSARIPLIGSAIYTMTALPLVAWERRSEITADRAGLLCCGSVETAERALLQLEAGFINADQIDMRGYVEKSRRYRRGSILRRVQEYQMNHPPLPKRIEALDLFAHSEVYYQAQGLAVPHDSISKARLEASVEHIIAVMGEG